MKPVYFGKVCVDAEAVSSVRELRKRPEGKLPSAGGFLSYEYFLPDHETCRISFKFGAPNVDVDGTLEEVMKILENQ